MKKGNGNVAARVVVVGVRAGWSAFSAGESYTEEAAAAVISFTAGGGNAAGG